MSTGNIQENIAKTTKIIRIHRHTHFFGFVWRFPLVLHRRKNKHVIPQGVFPSDLAHNSAEQWFMLFLRFPSEYFPLLIWALEKAGLLFGFHRCVLCSEGFLLAFNRA